MNTDDLSDLNMALMGQMIKKDYIEVNMMDMVVM